MNQAISEHISRILLITYSLWYFMTKAIPLNIRLIYLKKDYLISDCQRIIAFTLVLLSEGKKTTFLFQ